MNWALLSIFFVFHVRLLFAYVDIVQMGYEQYQDIFINGKVVKRATHNHRDCETRYEIIQSVLKEFERPFTMVDLGASQGYYSFRMAFDYPQSVAVMIEGNNPAYPVVGTQLQSICLDNTEIRNVIFLNKRIEIEDLKRLGECEHFDVVLALNVIHWFPKQWKQMISAIIDLGSDIIVETPPLENEISEECLEIRKSIIEYLETLDSHVIGRVPRHTSPDLMCNIYHIRGKRDRLVRKTWICSPNQGNTHRILTNYKQKVLTKKIACFDSEYQSSEWKPGINLITYIMYHGTYPTRNAVVNMMWKLRNVPHNDWMVNNMILQGKKLCFIDFNDPNHNPGGLGGGRKYSHALYRMLSRFIKIEDPEKAIAYYYREIPRVP